MMKKCIFSMLAIFLVFTCFIISGCIKTVSNYDITIKHFGVDYSGQFTGNIRKGIPVDSENGTFISGETGSGNYLKYDGLWQDGIFAYSGTLLQESYELKIGDRSLVGYYEGNVFDGLPDGEGIFSMDDDVIFEYSGNWAKGEPSGNGTLKCNNYEISYADKKLTGEFDGKVVDGLPNGEGKFFVNDNVVFEYTGNWSKGKISGKGNLEYSEYVITFSDNTERVGSYKGEVIDGIPEGNGIYNTFTEENGEYTYTGSFSKGTYHGHGKRVFKDGSNGILEGNWDSGNFRPTVTEFIQTFGTIKDKCEYTLTEEEKAFISENEDFFTNTTDKPLDGLINTSFDLKTYQKNQLTKPCFVKINNLSVVQIQEIEQFGRIYTMILATDSNFDNYFYIYKFNDTPGVVEGNTISITFLPLGYSTYETVLNSKNWAVVGFAINIS